MPLQAEFNLFSNVRMLELKVRKKGKSEKRKKSKRSISYRPTGRLKKLDLSTAGVTLLDFSESFILGGEKQLHLLVPIFESTVSFAVRHIFQVDRLQTTG